MTGERVFFHDMPESKMRFPAFYYLLLAILAVCPRGLLTLVLSVRTMQKQSGGNCITPVLRELFTRLDGPESSGGIETTLLYIC